MARYLVPELADFKQAPNLEFNELVKGMRARGEEVVHLAFGQSPFPVPDHLVPALAENAANSEYVNVAGLLSLREEICAFHRRHDGLRLHPDDVIVGPGSKTLIFLVFKVFQGDILLVSPCFPAYLPQCVLAGHKRPFVIDASADTDWKLTPRMLEDAVARTNSKAKKLLMTNSPNNPTGAVYTASELRLLSEVCRKHDILVLSDEIYARSYFDSSFPSMATAYPEATIVTTGFSKMLSAGGWRVGYLLVPAQLASLREAVLNAASHVYSCAAAPQQKALIKGMQDPDSLDSYLVKQALILKTLAKYCEKNLSCAGVAVTPCSGGYYLFPDFELCRRGLEASLGRSITGADLCTAMLNLERVALLPGSCFCRSESELTTRLCFTDLDGGVALRASAQAMLEDPDRAVITWAPNIHKGINSIAAFVQKWTLDE